MNGDLGAKLDQILANPAMLAQIKTLADTMTAGGSKPPEPAEQENEALKTEKESLAQDKSVPLPALPSLSPIVESNLKNTRNLLIALKPFLDDKRCAKVDKMLSMMRIAEMAGQFGSFF